MDTIYALSTASGKAGVAIIRVSGPAALRSVETLCRVDGLEPRKTSLRVLRDTNEGIIDEALVVFFEKNHSFTGEPVVEYHIHGSTAIIHTLQNALSKIPSYRPAEPGEFTRRALDNGRLDVAQVEGLADLIDAETEAQRLQAQRVFSGALGDLVDGWRQKLIRAAALIEATIDFADEEVPENVVPEVQDLLSGVSTSLEQELSRSEVSERIRSGFEVAIIGPPNIGKSTLLNRLAGREAAITSDYAGTTRDVIEVRMDLNGLPVTFLDTAGLRETEDHVESIGIARTRARAETADLRLLMVEADEIPDIKLKEDDIVVVGKADLTQIDRLAVSGKTGEGVNELVKRIGEVLSERTQHPGLAIRDRHRQAMAQGLDALYRAENMILSGFGDDVIAEEIRYCLRSLDSVIGRVDVESVLDEIFSSFCLGK